MEVAPSGQFAAPSRRPLVTRYRLWNAVQGVRVRAVCQRVGRARVLVEGEVVGAIGRGWAVLLGVGREDTEAVASALAEKLSTLRVFEDASGRMARSAREVDAEFLVVSQITLHADLSRGRRPSLAGAAPPERAAPLVEHFADELRLRGFSVATGRVGAMMDVELINHGPVTFVLSTDGWD